MLLDLTIERIEIETQFLADDSLATALVLIGEEWGEDSDISRTARIELTRWRSEQKTNEGALTVSDDDQLGIELSISPAQFSYLHDLALRKTKDQELLMHVELPDELKADESRTFAPFFQVTLVSDSGGAT